MLRYAEVSLRYGEVVAVDALSLKPRCGTTTALIGPSGCGKSSLLRLAVGLVQADSGAVTVLGAPLCAADMAVRRRAIGYVIQEGGLFPHLDVERNVTLVARELGWDAARRTARFEELLELVKLPHAIARRGIHEISGGQRQRVSIMRALMLDPPLLLLDEPLGALDPMVRSELQADLAMLFERLVKTVLLVTHDIAECAVLARHVVLMNAGRIEQQGAIAELIETPASAFVRAFVGAQRGAREILAERLGA